MGIILGNKDDLKIVNNKKCAPKMKLFNEKKIIEKDSDDFDFETNESLGVYLVQALTDQLDGSLLVDNNQRENPLEKESGASFLVRFTPLTD